MSKYSKKRGEKVGHRTLRHVNQLLQVLGDPVNAGISATWYEVLIVNFLNCPSTNINYQNPGRNKDFE